MCETDEQHYIYTKKKFWTRNLDCTGLHDYLLTTQPGSLRVMKQCLKHMGGTYVDGSSFGSITEVPEYNTYHCERTYNPSGAVVYAEYCCPGE